MFTTSPSKKDDLVVMYNFAQSEIKNIGSAAGEVGKVRKTDPPPSWLLLAGVS